MNFVHGFGNKVISVRRYCVSFFQQRNGKKAYFEMKTLQLLMLIITTTPARGQNKMTDNGEKLSVDGVRCEQKPFMLLLRVDEIVGNRLQSIIIDLIKRAVW